MRFFVRIVFIGIFVLGAFYITFLQDDNEQAEESKTTREPESIEVSSTPNKKTIILERVYVDGEVSEEILYENVHSIQSVKNKYQDWQIVQMDEEQIVLQKKINDISPLLKANGYFGISDDGTISIFNGKPNNADIIQSFFQIDIKKLEGKKHEELKKGIPIKSKEDFDKVLETLKPYSIQKQQTLTGS
ncbi:BofC C-terminal domain-containing protein [Heyndrickxia vini]|uniref:BofC C-terminal domain-containing protein n=1 Tax=Heyndrickxia vini TaxID=1476025 RepID=A0ABX7E686_9BACI|nr:BofC C-terminal domain-containing protein [Heyndrickxia vini]QQZ10739.1 BofC C-terminal domain-containing protein [Heyndrickxia vini]